MAVLLQDNFDRAASTTVVGPPQVGPEPVMETGTWGISGNALYAPTLVSSLGRITWDVATPNVDITVTRSAGVLTSGYVMFGFVSVNDHWRIDFNSTGVVLAQIVNGVAAIACYFKTPTFALGQPLRLVHNDGVVEAFANGVSLGVNRLPAPVVGTKVGILVNNTAHRYDDLLVQDSAPISMNRIGQVYKGRSSETLDTGAAA